MSYCRWSSDDFQSDVYVYEHVSGHWAIHVAGNRVVWKVPLPPSVCEVSGLEAGDPGWAELWVARSMDIMKLMRDPRNYVREALRQPSAGANFECATPGEAAEVLEKLRGEGLRVPDGVIETLREEEGENA